MSAFTIDELSIPATLDAPGGDDFVAMTRVRNQIEADTLGSRELNYEPAELLPNWLDPYVPQRLFVARVGGEIVARAVYEAPVEDGSREVWFTIEVLEGHRRKGIGAAFFDRIVELADADDRRILQTYALQPPRGGERLSPRTGFGSVPVDSPTTRFLTSRGFTLEQVERMSRLPLPIDVRDTTERLTTLLDAAPDYRVVRWVGRTPEQWLDDIAMLHQRMSTDAPSAGMDFAEEKWDAARVREMDDRFESSPRESLTVAVEHVPSGKLVAFSELSVPPEPHRPVEQDDTLVLNEHRGRKLGMVVKLANLLHLEERFPGHPAVTTFNAEENRPMLDVNEAIGFVPVAYEGGWRLER